MAALSSIFDPADRSDPHAVLAGALAWWEGAGVVEPLTVAPRAWLDRAVVERAVVEVSQRADHAGDRKFAPSTAQAELVEALAEPAPASAARGNGLESSRTRPSTSSGWTEEAAADLPSFRQWLATTSLPGLPDGGERVVGEGPDGATIAVVIARPAARESLLDPPRRRLLSAMLRAIDIDIATVALIPVVPSAAGPIPQGEIAAAYRPILTRHLALIGAPDALLLGDGPCRTALGDTAARMRGRWHDVKDDVEKVRVMASLDLDLLLAQPACKRQAWADLLAFQAGAS